MTIDIKEWLRDKSITEVECLVSDISGIPRGKILPVHKYVSAIETGGLRLPEYVFGQSDSRTDRIQYRIRRSHSRTDRIQYRMR